MPLKFFCLFCFIKECSRLSSYLKIQCMRYRLIGCHINLFDTYIRSTYTTGRDTLKTYKVCTVQIMRQQQDDAGAEKWDKHKWPEDSVQFREVLINLKQTCYPLTGGDTKKDASALAASQRTRDHGRELPTLESAGRTNRSQAESVKEAWKVGHWWALANKCYYTFLSFLFFF